MSRRANGEGTVFKTPNGKWRAEVTLGWDYIPCEDGTTKCKRAVKTKAGFKFRREAIQWLKDFMASDEPVKSITFKQLYDRWSLSHFDKVSKSTSDGYVAAYSHCTSIHYKQIEQLKTHDLQKIVDDCPYGRRTKADIKSLFNNIYKYAMQNDYINKNYAEFIQLPKKEKSKKDAFTLDERNKLWADYRNGSDFTGYILLMIYTGMRFGELAKLTKACVNLDERCIVGGIKSDAGIDREMPISADLLPVVKKIYDSSENKLLTMHEKVFYNDFYATLERLGIRKLNPHCCRHTFATIMASAGVQPAIITATAGHANYSTTMQYTHIPLSDKIKAVDQIK